MTLGWILVASFAGGTLSAALAAFALALRTTWIPMLVSYAIGALQLPKFGHPVIAQFGWTIVLAILVAVVARAIMQGGLLTLRDSTVEEPSALRRKGPARPAPMIALPRRSPSDF